MLSVTFSFELVTWNVITGWGQVSLRQKYEQKVLAEPKSFGLSKSSA